MFDTTDQILNQLRAGEDGLAEGQSSRSRARPTAAVDTARCPARHRRRLAAACPCRAASPPALSPSRLGPSPTASPGSTHRGRSILPPPYSACRSSRRRRYSEPVCPLADHTGSSLGSCRHASRDATNTSLRYHCRPRSPRRHTNVDRGRPPAPQSWRRRPPPARISCRLRYESSSCSHNNRRACRCLFLPRSRA